MMPVFPHSRVRPPRAPRAWVGVVLGSVLGLGMLWLVAWLIGL